MAASDQFQEDVVLGRAFDRRLMGRLLRYGLPYRGRIAAVAALIVVVTALGVASPVIFQFAIDGPLSSAVGAGDPGSAAPSGALGGLLILVLALGAISAALMALRYLEIYAMATIGQRVMLDLRLELFEHLQRMPLSFYDRNPVGRLVTRITSDIEALNELFTSGVVTFVADVMVLAAITVTLVVFNATLALVTLAVVPILLAVTFVFRAKAREYYRDQRGHLAHLNAFTQESIQGMGIIQLFHQEERNFRRYAEVNGRYLDAFQKTVLAYSLYFPAVELLGTAALAAIVWKSGRLLGEGALTFGGFFLFWQYLGRFFQPIRDMAERYNVLQAAMAAAERIFKVLDSPVEPPQAPPSGRGPGPRGRVELKDVWFAYAGGEHVLKGVSFAVEPGETVAIVGATGAGKSTIASLLSRLYEPQRGSVELDGIDVREHDPRDLRRRVSIVLQDVFLFSRSIRDNIRLGDGHIPDARVEECARHVNAEPFILRLPGGFGHVLKERGATLSSGERQLLAFARALVHDPDLLVLDEATAHVDTETEVLIQDALAKLLRGRTSIVIAHRLSTLRRANRIIVLHKGEIREMGTHAELFERRGIYHKLHQLQYK
ncbi:MAG: ABC transporter ATP-binding protein [Planctomycetes bacterium]|nr:ABC transporter ATP-binding protein [Planctomycetota bacterium]